MKIGAFSGPNLQTPSLGSPIRPRQVSPNSPIYTSEVAVTVDQPQVAVDSITIDIPEEFMLGECLRKHLAPLYEKTRGLESTGMLDSLVEKRVAFLEALGISVMRFEEVMRKVRALDYLTAIADGANGSLGFFAGTAAYESKFFNDISQAATSWIGGQIERDKGRSCVNAFVEWMPGAILDSPAGGVRNAWLRRTDKENPYFTRNVGEEDHFAKEAMKKLRASHSTEKKVFEQASAYAMAFEGKAAVMASVNIAKAFTNNPAVNSTWASATCSVLAGGASKCLEHKFAEERAEAGVVPFLTRADFEAAFEEANQYDAAKWAKNTTIRVAKAPQRILAEIPDLVRNTFKPSTLLPAGVLTALGGALDATKFLLTYGMPDGVAKVALRESMNLLGFGPVVFGWGLVAFSPLDDVGSKLKIKLQCAKTGEELDLEIANDAISSSRDGAPVHQSNEFELQEVVVHNNHAIGSTTSDELPVPEEQAPGTGPVVSRIERFADLIETPGHWASQVGDITPIAIANALGRDLRIRDHPAVGKGATLIIQARARTEERPIVIAYANRYHYRGVVGQNALPTSDDGDCLFRSVLMNLNQEKDVSASAVKELRSSAAAEMRKHSSYYQDFLADEAEATTRL
ncbi:OTU domain-containing protein [Brucella anthropi]|uniref:OTU domain-containing protein n=1 Tax=Brucella anthropi TaxID=529 RepID=UPI00384F28D8